MDGLRSFLRGKKTHLAVAGAIIAAATSWANGQLTDGQALTAILIALSQSFQRTALTRENRSN